VAENSWGLRRLFATALKLAVVAALVASIGATTPTAGKGPRPRAACSEPTLTGPSVVAVEDTYSIAGCGFEPGQIVPFVGGEANGCCWSVNMVADANGVFSYEGWAWGSGTYTFKALESTRNSYRAAATWSFEAS